MCRGISSILLFYGLVIAALAGGYGEADRWQIPLPTRGAATFNIPIGTERNWTWHSVSGTVGDQRVTDAAWGVYERTGRFVFTNALSTNFFCAQVTTSFTYRGWTVTTYWGTLTNGIYTNQSVTNFAEVTGPDCTNCTTNAAITTQSVYCGTSPTGTILKAITNAFGYRDERAALVDVKSEIYGMAENFIDMNSITGTLAQYLTSGQAATSGSFNALTMLTTDKLIEYCGLPHELLITTNGGGSVSTNYIKTWFDYTPWRDLNGITSITQAYGTTTYYFGWIETTNFYNWRIQTNWGWTVSNTVFTSVVWTARADVASSAFSGWQSTSQTVSNLTFCGTESCGYPDYTIAFTNEDNIAEGYMPADYGWKKLPSIYSTLVSKVGSYYVKTSDIPVAKYANLSSYYYNYGEPDPQVGWETCYEEIEACAKYNLLTNGLFIDSCVTGIISEVTLPSYRNYTDGACTVGDDETSSEALSHNGYSDGPIYASPPFDANTYYLSNQEARAHFVMSAHYDEFSYSTNISILCNDGWNSDSTFAGLKDSIEYCRIYTNRFVYGFATVPIEVAYKYTEQSVLTGGDNDGKYGTFLEGATCVYGPNLNYHDYDRGFTPSETRTILRMDVDGGYLFY